MTIYGLLESGFVRKDAVIIQAELEQTFKDGWGNDVDLSPKSPDGILIGIWTEKFAELWELCEALYFSAFPDSATGAALDNAASLVGISRLPARYSTVTDVTLTNDSISPVTVPIG